jgi:membrane protein YdbS with pleckstrin-like domain
MSETHSPMLTGPLLLVAVVAAGLLVKGMLGLNPRMLIAGAIVAVVAVVVYVVMILRG